MPAFQKPTEKSDEPRQFHVYCYVERCWKNGMTNRDFPTIEEAADFLIKDLHRMMLGCLHYRPLGEPSIALYDGDSLLDRKVPHNPELVRTAPPFTAADLIAAFQRKNSVWIKAALVIDDYLCFGNASLSYAETKAEKAEKEKRANKKFKCFCGQMIAAKNSFKCAECNCWGCESCMEGDLCPDCREQQEEE